MQQGFSLTEILLSAALFGLFVSGLVGTLWYGTEANVHNIEYTQATLLAQEGIEAVRAIRNYPSFDWSSHLGTGTYNVTTTNGFWEALTGSSTIDTFTRGISIEPIDQNRRKVTSNVIWQQTLNRTGSVFLTSYLTNWQTTTEAEKALRVTEYLLDDSEFTGTTYDLTLKNPLDQNYFILVAGSDGDGVNNGGNTNPNQNYIGLTADPFGTGDLATSTGSSTLSFHRGDNSNNWYGVITVVECLGTCDTHGFKLKSVELTTASGSTTNGSDTSATGWDDIDQTVLFGGGFGSGCYTTENNRNNHNLCSPRLYPSGTNQINWTRNAGGQSLSTAEFTIMVVEWGSEWTVQRVNVLGISGGNGANQGSHYDQQTLSTSIARDNTWVWGTGWTTDNGIGDGPEGVLVTIGDGVSETSSPITTVAVGSEYNDNKDFEVYTMTHDNLLVDYRFKTDGDSGSLVYDATVDTATDNDSRFTLVYNGSNGNGTAFPRPFWSARYLNSDTVRLERRRSGQNWPAWIQGINTANITQTTGGGGDTIAPSAISNLALSNMTTSSIQLDWTAPGDDGASGMANNYDVRYSTAGIITANNWTSATQAAGEPTPQTAGSSESMTVAGLSPNTLYYFAIKTADEVPNISSVSNSPSASTLATMASQLTINASGVGVNGGGGPWGGNATIDGITIENTGVSDVTITGMTITWSGSSATTFDYIRILPGGNNNYTSGGDTSGTQVAFSDNEIISGGATHEIDRLRFDDSVLGMTLDIVLHLSDGSSINEAGISL